MSAELAARATEPFVSGSDRGTGLGLSIVANIVRNWGGRMAIDSGEGKGTRIVIEVPAARPDRPAETKLQGA